MLYIHFIILADDGFNTATESFQTNVYIVSFIVFIFTILNIHAYSEWWFATLGKLPDLWACIHIEEI